MIHRRVSLARLLAGVLFAAFLGAGAALAQPYTFAVVPKAINNPFFNQARDGCMVKADELGVTCEFTGPPQTEIAPQIQVLEGLIQRGVDGIALSPVDASSVVPVIQRAKEAGIPVITFDSDAAEGSGRLTFVGTDNFAAGQELGKLFLRFAPNGAKYGIVTGGLGAQNLNQRIAGFKDVVTGESYVEVGGSPFPTNDDINRGVQLIEQMITANPDLNAIVMVGGWPLFAPEAYKSALQKVEAQVKANEFVIVSFDTLPSEVQLLKEGYVHGLVGQRPYAMGEKSVELLYNLVALGQPIEQEFYNTGVDIVTQENVDEFLTATGP